MTTWYWKLFLTKDVLLLQFLTKLKIMKENAVTFQKNDEADNSGSTSDFAVTVERKTTNK